MSNQKFDSKTTKKLLNNYQKTISHYTEENKLLSTQLQDLKTTLALNQNLLYDFITNSVGKDEKINNLITESKNLWQENENLMKQKNDLEIKTSKLQELIEDTPTQIREEINQINQDNNKMKAELLQKDNLIKKLKNDLEKARKNALFKTARAEVLVTEPTKNNVEINHELLNTKTILSRVSQMHAQEKKKASKLDKEVKSLQDEVNNLKKNTSKLESVNSTMKRGVNTNNIIDNLNDEKEDEKDEDDDDDDENDENESDSDDDDEGDKNIQGKKPKTKQKELEQLTAEYNRLKKQNEESENKLNKYKKIYKEMKAKIKSLNQINPNDKNKNKYNVNINLAPPSTDDATSHKNIWKFRKLKSIFLYN